MVICHISTTFVARAGSARRTYAIIRALADAEHEVINIFGTVSEFDSGWDFTGIRNIQIPSLVKYISPKNDLRAYTELSEVLRKLRPDVVHTHLAKAGVIGRLAAGSAGIAHILHTVHGPTFASTLSLPKRTLYWALERFAASYTEKFVFVGDDLRKKYVAAGICTVRTSEVIRTGRSDAQYLKADAIDSNAIRRIRRRLGIRPGDFVIGCVGRVVPNKGQSRALGIASRLKQAGVRVKLLIIGEAFLPEEQSYMDRLKEIAIKKDIEENVLFLGFRKNIFLYMKSCDVIIMVSKYEGLPNVAVEAAISSRPLVSFFVNGVEEVIDGGGWGKVFPQQDEEGLSSFLVFLANNRHLLERMGLMANTAIRTRYNQKKMIEEKLALYGSIVGEFDSGC